MNHRPVCTKCNVELFVAKNDVACVDMASFGRCKIWSCDRWECPGCGISILVGFGYAPIAEHYQTPRFEQVLQGYQKEGEEICESWESLLSKDNQKD